MTIKNLDRRISFTEGRKAVNENFAALVEHLGEKAEVVVGMYVGDGEASRDIELGFTPVAVLLESAYGTRPNNTCQGGLALQDFPIQYNYLSIIEGGFRVETGSGTYLNGSGTKYYYLALKTV